jgi:hypothetical protein
MAGINGPVEHVGEQLRDLDAGLGDTAAPPDAAPELVGKRDLDPVGCAGFMSGRYKQVKLPVFYRLSFLAGRLRRR